MLVCLFVCLSLKKASQVFFLDGYCPDYFFPMQLAANVLQTEHVKFREQYV